MNRLEKAKFYLADENPNAWVYITDIYYNNKNKHFYALFLLNNYELYERPIFFVIINENIYEAINLPSVYLYTGCQITKLNKVGDSTMFYGLI